MVTPHSKAGNSAYLLVKADASQIPLRAGSVRLVIATPPYFGGRRRHKSDFCTRDAGEYRKLMSHFLAEAMRILRPGGHVLLFHKRPRRGLWNGARQVTFEVLDKTSRDGRWARRRRRFERFRTHYIDVEGCPWWALPVGLYRTLLGRYSRPEDTVVHVFSGSGNGGIAAVELARKPVLIDLYYHRLVKRRLDRWVTY